MSGLPRIRACCRLLLAIWLLGAVAPVAGALHAVGDDAACGERSLAQQPTPQLAGVESPADQEHCDVCHLQRTLRAASTRTPIDVVVVQAARIDAVLPGARLLAAVRFDLTGRAPPVSLA